MKILALDLATSTGWALCMADGHIESGVQIFDLKRGESPGMRFIRFRKWLNFMVAGFSEGDLVAFEQAHHRGGAATQLAVGLSTRVLEICAERSLEHTSVHSATLKKFVTGVGNASKEWMLKEARRLYGPDIESHDEADARHLLRYVMETYLTLTQDRKGEAT